MELEIVEKAPGTQSFQETLNSNVQQYSCRPMLLEHTRMHLPNLASCLAAGSANDEPWEPTACNLKTYSFCGFWTQPDPNGRWTEPSAFIASLCEATGADHEPPQCVGRCCRPSTQTWQSASNLWLLLAGCLGICTAGIAWCIDYGQPLGSVTCFQIHLYRAAACDWECRAPGHPAFSKTFNSRLNRLDGWRWHLLKSLDHFTSGMGRCLCHLCQPFLGGIR